MIPLLVDKIARAVLYEGYMLYPYRPCVKNRQRWTFGGIYPRAYSQAHDGSEPWTMQTQCLLRGGPEALLEVQVRALQLVDRRVGQIDPPVAAWPATGTPSWQEVPELHLGDQLYQPWQEARERTVTLAPRSLGDLSAHSRTHRFCWPEARTLEALPAPDGTIAGVLVRQQGTVAGIVTLAAEILAPGLYRIAVHVANHTPFDPTPAPQRDAALLHALVSTHLILHVRSGAFLSSFDPPEDCRHHAAACRNQGAWPVLVGTPPQADTVLAAPIILYDYPQVAPESPGDLFDGTEIDEILTLRILTLTEEEKRAAAIDAPSAALLARAAALGRQELMGLHGTFRRPEGTAIPETFPAPPDAAALPPWDPLAPRQELQRTLAGSIELKPGDHVVLHPGGRGDIMDLALEGRTATIIAIEQDYENRIHVAVTVDDDPGRDLGAAGKIAHRFFFSVAEVEPVPAGAL